MPLAAALWAGPAHAQQYTWGGAGATTSDYGTATNWSNPPAGAPPVAPGSGAIFDNTGKSSVNVAAPINPDVWQFGATNQAYIFAGSTVTFGGAGIVIDPGSANDILISNAIAGAGGIQHDGSNKLTLTGTNTYTGTTAVCACGALQIGNGGTTGTLPGDVTVDGTLIFNRSNDYEYAGVIGGLGEVRMDGTGTLTLSSANTYNFITTINAGTLAITNASSLGTSQVGLLGGRLHATQTLNVANDLFFVGTGAVTATTGTMLTLSGSLFFDPNSVATFGAPTAAGTIDIQSGFVGTDNDAHVVIAGGRVVDNNTSLSFQLGSGASTTVNAGAILDFANNPFSGIRNLRGEGAIILGTDPAPGFAHLGLAVDPGTSSLFSGVISGPGGVQVATSPFGPPGVAGTVIFAGNNTYLGDTYICECSTLQIGNGGTTGAIPNTTVFNAGTLIFNRSNSYTFGGVISDDPLLAGFPGQVVHNGTGHTILTNVNTYTGATAVNAGTLEIGSTGSITSNVTNHATFINAGTVTGNLTNNGNASNTGTWNGDVTNGSGTFINTGTVVGTTTVNGGQFTANGANGAVIVNGGGTLGGSGSVGNTTITNGNLSPGNSIGTLTVNGNLVLSAAAAYLVEVDAAGADRTVVTGTATLAGSVQALFATGPLLKRYTILTANGGLNGTFGSLTNVNLPPGFAYQLTYDPNNVYLSLTAALGGALPQNQQNVATSLNTTFNAGGQLPARFFELFRLTGTDLATGLNQITGEIATQASQAAFTSVDYFLNLMLDPFVSGRGGEASSIGPGANNYASDAYAAKPRGRTPAEQDAYAAVYRKALPRNKLLDARWSVWGAAFGGELKADGNPSVTGSRDALTRTFGFAAGIDYRLSPDTLVGFALSGGGTSFSLAQGGGKGRSDVFQAGAFVRHNIGQAYLKGAVAYGWHDVTTDRTIAIAGIDQLQGRYDANSLGGRGEAGYRFLPPWTGVGLTPYVAGQAITYFQPGYGDQAALGLNTFALNYSSHDVTTARSEVGLRADKSFVLQTALLTLRGRAAWAHYFDDNRALSASFLTFAAPSFVVTGAAQARDAALVSASADVKWTNGVSLAGVFEGEFSGQTRGYAGKGVLRYQW